MLIERTKNEVIIRLPSFVDTEGLQELIDNLIHKQPKLKLKGAKQLAKTVKKRVTTKEYNKQLNAADARIAKRKFLRQQDLEKEVAKW
jgi:hypothetical protein